MKDKLTIEDIQATIIREEYHVFPESTTTVCCLYLKNGYTTIGSSACVVASNFNEVIGRTIAKQNALNEIWKLEGYLLREDHHKAQQWE